MSAARSSPPEWMSPEEFQETQQTLELISFFVRSMDLAKFRRRLELAEVAPQTDPTVDATAIPYLKAMAAAAEKFGGEVGPPYKAWVEARAAQQLTRRRKLSS
jgi:hypothetical protein